MKYKPKKPPFVPLLVNFTLQVRQILFYENHFKDFFNKQTEKTKSKIDDILFMITILERVHEKFLKHIERTEVYLKSELHKEVIYFAFSAVSTKGN